jgi:hypothetical protein
LKIKSVITALFFLILIQTEISAQYLSQKSFLLSGGVNSYKGSFVRNDNNGNSRASFSGNLDFQNKLSNLFSYRVGIGAGHMRNMENVFPTEASSDFFRFSGGLILNGNSGFFYIPKEPTKIQPYLHLGYHFDYIGENLQVGYSKMLGSLNFGAGSFIKINEFIGLSYRYSLNQRLGQDYRTFYLHEFGVIIPVLKMKKKLIIKVEEEEDNHDTEE